MKLLHALTVDGILRAHALRRAVIVSFLIVGLHVPVLSLGLQVS